jgi:hypothetical protein
MATATKGTLFDLSTKEGAQAAAEEVAKRLGPNWKISVRCTSFRWTFTVSLETSGYKSEIEVTPEVSGRNLYTAWIHSDLFSDFREGTDVVDVVKRVREALQDRINDLINLSTRIADRMA